MCIKSKDDLVAIDVSDSYGRMMFKIFIIYKDFYVVMKKLIMSLMLKAIGGGPGQNFHFELFGRAPLGGTKAFCRMSKLIFVRGLLHFEVRDFGGISCGKIEKSQIL